MCMDFNLAVVVLLSTLAGITVALQIHHPCPTGYVFYPERQRCFKAFLNDKKTWMDARTACKAEGGDLAVIPDEDTDDFIKDQLIWGGYPPFSYWFGLQNHLTVPEGVWKWVDGSILVYEGWGGGEPNGAHEFCVAMYDYQHYPAWIDKYCGGASNYICERGIDASVSTRGWSCPRGYMVYYESDVIKFCVRVYHNHLTTWADARQVCRNGGGDLYIFQPTMQTANLFIGSLLKIPNTYWIGDEYCGVYVQTSTTYQLSQACGTPNRYVCKHDGHRIQHVDLEEMTTIDRNTFYVTHGKVQFSEMETLCLTQGLEDIDYSHLAILDWLPTSPFKLPDAEAAIWFKFPEHGWRGYGTVRTLASPCGYRQVLLPADTYYGLCVKELPVPQVCPSGYDYYHTGGRCYKTYTKQNKDWFRARQHCQNERADLVVIQDAGTNTFIEDLMSRQPEAHWMWLGLGEIRGTTKYIWLDDTAVTYSRWASLEPSNDAGSDQDCATASYSIVNGLSTWNDIPCKRNSVSLYYPDHFCEKAAYVIPACPNGYVFYNQTQKKCFRVETQRKIWSLARRTCMDEGGDLASIPDQETNTFIAGLLQSETVFHYKAFLGLLKDDSSWQWVDGTSMTFTDWSQPNPSGDGSCGEKVEMVGYQGWNDLWCSSTRASLCQQDPVLGVECPQGYTSFVRNDHRIICFLVVEKSTKTWEDAARHCRDSGGELYKHQEEETVMNDFIKSLLVVPESYWIQYSPSVCLAYTYNTSDDSFIPDSRPCWETRGSTLYGHICQRWGTNTWEEMVDMAEWSWIPDQVNHYDKDGLLQGSKKMTEFCHGLSALAPTPSSLSPTITHAAFNVTPSQLKHAVDQECHTSKCCTEVTTTSPYFNLTAKTNMTMMFPYDKLWCVCDVEKDTTTTMSTTVLTSTTTTTPSTTASTSTPIPPTPTPTNTRPTPIPPQPDPGDPVTEESMDYLRNMTTMTSPKNGSTATKKLCPCRCDSPTFDPNPDPEVLAQMLSKIQTELKVDTEKLSNKRNKKVSAQDSRTGSQTLGYLSVVVCLVPFGFLVAVDVLRFWQK